MKRLRKKANIDNSYNIEEALVNLIFTNDGSNLVEMYNEVLSNDSDCLYNSTVYRILYLDYKKLISNMNVKKDEMGIYVKCGELVDEIYNNVYSGDWQSTTKSLENINSLGIDITVSNPISVVIKFECKNGIDLEKLAKKYLKVFTQNNSGESYIRELKEMANIASMQQEVYTQVPKNYEIVSISDININEFTGTVNILNLEI